MRQKRLFAAAAVAAVLAAAPVEAQVFTPTFMAPRPSNEFGIYFADVGDFGLEGILRRNFGGTNLGFRGGVVDGADDTLITLGGELRSPLTLGTAPLDLSLIAGVQGVLGDDAGEIFGVQGGVSLGYTFNSPGVAVTPYVAPRLALLVSDDESEAEVLADLGVDVDLRPNLSLRLGIGLGEPQADWGIGLAWRR